MQQLPDPAADRLIADQYADRPQLRSVLDAVLAAAPALGAPGAMSYAWRGGRGIQRGTRRRYSR